MAWRTINGGGAAQVGPDGRPSQPGMFWSDNALSDGGNIAVVLAYSQLTAVKAQVDAAIIDLKNKRVKRTQWYGQSTSTDPRENGLKSTTRNVVVPAPTLQPVTYDQSSLDSLAESLVQRDRYESQHIPAAEEAQDTLLGVLGTLMAILSNERLWGFLGGSQNGLLALVLTGGFQAPPVTDFGAAA